MKKKVVAITQKPGGSIFQYDDGTSEMLEGVFAQLSPKEEENEQEEEDDDSEEEMMKEMRKSQQ